MFLYKWKLPSYCLMMSSVLCILCCFFVLSSFHGIANDVFFESEIYSFDYISVEPAVELPENPCVFSCVIFPSKDISSVQIVLTDPRSNIFVFDMKYHENGKYYYQKSFQEKGRYYFFIQYFSKSEGKIESNLHSFWISSSYSDKDDDGIPDTWEKRYGLNNEFFQDAFFDPDNDGFSNIDEYHMHTHPLENNPIENGIFKLQEKQTYFILSFLLFFILIMFSLFGMWRETI